MSDLSQHLFAQQLSKPGGLVVLCIWLFVVAGCGSPAPSDVPPQPLVDARELWLEEMQTHRKSYKLEPLSPAQSYTPAQVALGHALFFDPILSANKDVACSTCHQPQLGMSNGLALAAGTLAVVRDGVRTPGERKAFTPRNVPDLFNRDQPTIRTMFWDSRLEQLSDGRFVLYDKAEEKREGAFLRVLDPRLTNIIAAQTMLPVLNRDELRGHWGDKTITGDPNLIAQVRDTDFETSWRMLFQQVWAVEAYRPLLKAAYPNEDEMALGYVHLANALGAFIGQSLTLRDSPWDKFLEGDQDALDDQALHGATIFFGQKARCGQCHNGVLLSDQSVHNIGVRPMTRGPDEERGLDLGAQHRSHYGPEGRFAFRTPPLRNVELTSPYMHTGMYRTLEDVIEHKNDAWQAFWSYGPEFLDDAFASQLHRDSALIEPVTMSLAVPMQQPLALTADEKIALVAFLKALTSPTAKTLTTLKPDNTVSGLIAPE